MKKSLTQLALNPFSAHSQLAQNRISGTHSPAATNFIEHVEFKTFIFYCAISPILEHCCELHPCEILVIIFCTNSSVTYRYSEAYWISDLKKLVKSPFFHKNLKIIIYIVVK